MPITIEHGPISLAGTLALGAGETKRLDTQHQWDVDSARLSLQAQAESNRVRA